MRVEFPNSDEFDAISDDSRECNSKTAFLLTEQNRNFLNTIPTCNILTPREYLKMLGLKDTIKIIGITGTNGKTTTAAIIYSILIDLGKKVAFQGTRGYFANGKRVKKKSLTTPPILQTIENIRDSALEGCEYFIMEVSSHAIKQKRVEGLKFALKIFTNVTQDHLDFHKTIDAYIAIKSKFFDDETLKLINKDDKNIRYNKKNCMTYGVENPSSYKAAAYSLSGGVSAVVQKIDKMYDFSSPLYGFFNLYNILAAIGAVDMLKVAPMQEICEVIENFAGVEGRMEIVSNEPLIIVDFAHTPDGMKEVLDSLKNKSIVVVFGAGGDRDRDKRAKMGSIASRYAKKNHSYK